MGKILFAWIGNADLAASEASDSAGGKGPIGQAVSSDTYDALVLLSDHDKSRTVRYCRWLQCASPAEILVEHVKLSSPTAFGEIYEAATAALKKHAGRLAVSDAVFHLSPGTPAMAAVWIILAKTRFPAALIESSKQHGVRVASVPFDISADYLPDLLRKPDEELVRLAQGLSFEAPEFDSIIHRSSAMKKVIAKARLVAPRSVPVLLLGESGTGKELLARAIHEASSVKHGPFQVVNCGAIPPELVESELFGHVKGAFTGAAAARKGYLEAASGGTLFLDEIGELPAPAQVKLLRSLQQSEVTPVGSTKPVAVSFRLVCATNRDLFSEVPEGRFREDLFHRIAVAVLKLPPLREREGDVGVLVDRLLERINEEARNQPGYQHKKFSVKARNLLLQYAWPGNVRELINTLQRSAIWSTGSIIDEHEVRDALLPLARNRQDILDRPLGDGFHLQDIMNSVARHYLERAMEEAGNTKTKAADLLGLPSYQTLTNWLKRYGLDG